MALIRSRKSDAGFFAIRDINLKRLESRPSKQRPFDYVFYVDLEGHREDEPVSRALEPQLEPRLPARRKNRRPDFCADRRLGSEAHADEPASLARCEAESHALPSACAAES